MLYVTCKGSAHQVPQGCLKQLRMAEVCRIIAGQETPVPAVLGQGAVSLGAMPSTGVEGFPWVEFPGYRSSSSNLGSPSKGERLVQRPMCPGPLCKAFLSPVERWITTVSRSLVSVTSHLSSELLEHSPEQKEAW